MKLRIGNVELDNNLILAPMAGVTDMSFRQLCRELDVPLTVERADVPALARQRGVGLEEAGRMARYDFFRRTADSLGAQRIATAHHAADQAETVLLNLVRGTGMQGLAGIPPVRGRIVRPLLETSRDDIETYLKTHGLSHVEDETNRDTSLGRNRLRREVMPGLLSLHPGAAASICRTAELLRTGRLVICPGCGDAIREFGLYRWDTSAGGRDQVCKEHDHAMDDIRYFAVTVAAKERGGSWAGSVERRIF